MPPNPDSPADQAEASSSLRFAPGSFIGHGCSIRPLGSGGMADVFLARDTHLGRKVATKVVQPDRLQSKTAVDRFLFEARTTARINHTHIITAPEVGLALLLEPDFRARPTRFEQRARGSSRA